MRAPFAAVLLSVGIGLPMFAQSQVIAPTPLEALASRPDAVLTFAKTVGRLESSPAGVALDVAAIEVEATGASPMRGVRIVLRRSAPPKTCDLLHTEWAEMCRQPMPAAFIDEARLATFREQLNQGSAVVHDGHRSGITHFRASGAGIYRSGVLMFGTEVNGTTIPQLLALVDLAIAALPAR
jgi:hypothetical protein